MKLRAIMVDDEELARKRLRSLLKVYEHEVELLGEAKDGKEALAKIGDLKPDLVFLDIQMPGMDGFDVVRNLRTKPFIVFITAYDEYALRAFEENSIDYLLKPVDRQRLESTMQKLRRLFDRGGSTLDDKIDKLISQISSTPLKRIHVKIGEKIILVNVDDIVYFEARDKYCFLHTVNHEHITDLTLTELEGKLKRTDFVRVHRSAIVNVNHIREIVKWFGGKLKLKMSDAAGSELIVSRSHASSFR